MYRRGFRPWRDVHNLRRDFQQIVEDFLGFDPSTGKGYWIPPVDVIETDEGYVVNVEIPGIAKQNIKIDIQNNILNLSGEKKPVEEWKEYYQAECYYGKFNRSITIPGEIEREKVTAKYHNGVLQIVLPRKESDKKREIKIEVS